MFEGEQVQNQVERKLTPLERRFTRSPYYLVTMIARIKGHVTEEMFRSACLKVQQRHANLRALVVDDTEQNPRLIFDSRSELHLEIVPRTSENQWLAEYHRQYKIPFEFEKRPPIRFILVQSKEASELIIFCHHIICDGKSLAYVARDIMLCLGDTENDLGVLPNPEPVNQSTMPSDVKANVFVRFFINSVNKKWNKIKVTFDQEDYENLLEAYWSRYNQKMVPVELPEDKTSELVKRCKQEGVTVNSALLVAFVGAQTVIRGIEACDPNIGVIGSVRDRLNVAVGEAMGFFAGHVEIKFKYQTQLNFWDNVRRFHRKIKPMYTNKNLFREAILYEYLDPTLIEATTFKMEGGLVKEGASRFKKLSDFRNRVDVVSKILKRNRVDTPERTVMDTAITNLTNLDFPRQYGSLELDRMLMNPGISAHYNLVLGALSCAGKLSLVVAHIEEKVDSPTMENIIKTALEFLA